MQPIDANERDHRDATEIARLAGDLLLDLRVRSSALALSGKALGGEGDRRSHQLIADLLAERHPDDALLSEESADDPRRLEAHRVWIVDPLDGTREFAELDRWDWSVHVALVVDGRLVAAAVAVPARGLVLATPTPRAPERQASLPRFVVSRTRPPSFVPALAEALGGEVIPMGSAGAKTMAVVLGEADVYVHAGGQYEWDSAAPVAVALAAGLRACRLDGSPLHYNRPDPWLPDLVVACPELADAVVRTLGPLTSSPATVHQS